MVTAMYKAVWTTIIAFGVLSTVLLGVHKYGSYEQNHPNQPITIKWHEGGQ